MNDILVIIPAFNEEMNITFVAENLIRNHPDLDYVIVNDGSQDRTAEICRRHSYHMLDLPVNLGLAGAFQAGMRYACEKGYRYAVQFDIVIASRFVTEKKPHSLRMIGSRLIAAAIFLTTGQKINDPTSGMRMYNEKMIRIFAKKINYAPEPDTLSLLMRHGAKTAEIQAVMDLRTAGVSYLTPFVAVNYMVRTLISILFIQRFR